MKLLVALFLLTTQLYAQSNIEAICSSIVRIDGGRIVTFAPSFHKGFAAAFSEGAYVVTNPIGEKLIEIPEQVVGLVVWENSLWILTPSRLLEFTSSGEYQGQYLSSLKRLNASLSLSQNQLLVARGAGGLVAFDLTKKEIAWENRLGDVKDGWPVAVTQDGKKGYAAVQASREGGFTGIMTFDLSTGMVLQRSAYNYAYGVIGIDVHAAMYKGSVVLNNQGWIHLLTNSQISSGRSMKPRWVAYQVPRNGDVNPHYMMLEGDFLIDGQELVGCGKYNAPTEAGIALKGKVFRVKLD